MREHVVGVTVCGANVGGSVGWVAPSCGAEAWVAEACGRGSARTQSGTGRLAQLDGSRTSIVEITERSSRQQRPDGIPNVSVNSDRPATFPRAVVPSPTSSSLLLPHLPMWPSPRLPWPPWSSVRGE